MQMNDATIVQRACCGDETALVELVELYQSPIYRLCYRMLGESIEAEDAAQETFLRAYRHLNCFQPGRSFRTWLFAIATHYCIDCLRRRRPLALPLEADVLSRNPSLVEAGPGPEGSALIKEDSIEFQRLLARLSPRDRDVIVMHYWGAQSYEEIARATGASTEAIKSRLHRARATLATMLVERPHPSKSVPVGARAYA